MTDNYVEIGKSIVMLYPEHDTNVTCIELNDSLVFVDAGRRSDVTTKFREDMEKKFGKRTSHLFLTHYHFDHYGGMSAFKDVEIVAAKEKYDKFVDDLKLNTKERRAAVIEHNKKVHEESGNETHPVLEIHWKYYPIADLFPPTITVDKTYEYGDETRKVIFTVTGGHSDCSAYIYIPSEKTVIVGDNLATDSARVGGCFFGGINEKTVSCLEEVEKLEVDTVIPGHGPKTDIQYLTKARKYFDNLFNIFRSLIEEDDKPEDFSTDSRIPEFYDEPHERWPEILDRQYERVRKVIVEEAIEERKKSLFEVRKQKNLDEILNHYTKKLMILAPNGFSIEEQEVFKRMYLANFKALECKYTVEEKYILAEKVVEKGKYYEKYDLNGTINEYEKEYINIWEKEDGDWKLSVDFELSSENLT